MGDNKQIVAFLDFWGFKKYYEFIKIQKKEESQEDLFKAFTCLYHNFSKRLRESLEKIPKLMSDTGEGSKFDFIKSTQILVISDSIVISIDCNDENVKDACAFLCFLLASAIDESAITDSFADDLKKYSTFFVLPIRGAISYDYSITKLSEPNPFIFSNAYNNAVALEREARWPRILIAPDLYSRIAQSSFTKQGRYVYFDYLKFKYSLFISNPRVSFKTKEAKHSLIQTILGPYKNQIELATKEAALIHANKENSLIDPFKYGEWIKYYNEKIDLLFQADEETKSLNLALPDHFFEKTFNFEVRGESNYYTICILPWIHFDQNYEVNNTKLLQYPEHNFDRDFKLALKEILKSYKELTGDQVNECTVVVIENAKPEWHLDKDEGDLEKVQSDLALYFLSAFSKNKYFTQHSTYINSTAFQPIFQNHTIPPSGKAVQHRRRDGNSTDMGYQHGDLKYSRPLECKSLKPKMDRSFLEALSKLAKDNTDFYRRVLGSISFVQLANTDQPQMFLESEAILMASAFEQLFDAENKYDLTRAYQDCFGEYEMKKVKDVLDVRNGIKLDGGKDEGKDLKWQLGRKWIHELYALRNSVVHGNDLSNRTWGWSPFEHLIMAAYVFPLAVKVLLSKNNKYKLTDSDKQLCKSIDLLLAIKDWEKPPDGQSSHTNWEEQISYVGRHMRSQKLVELLEENNFFEDEEGTPSS